MSDITSWPPKHHSEHLDYEATFTPPLLEGEEIVEHSAEVTNGTIEITKITLVGSRMLVWIKGGKKDELARVLCLAKTNQDRTLALDPFLPIT